MMARKTQGKRISNSDIERIRTEMDKLGTEIKQFRPALESYQSTVRRMLFHRD